MERAEKLKDGDVIRKDIIWYEWYYQISNFGRVKTLVRRYKRKEKVLSNNKLKSWYETILLHKENKIKPFLVHRLVAKAFIENGNNKLEVNHKNWIVNDNRVENLEWCTKSENHKHAYKYLWRINNMSWKFWIDNQNSRKVIQKDKLWNIVKIWNSFSDIVKALWLSQWCLSECCSWKRKTVWWYIRFYYLIN